MENTEKSSLWCDVMKSNTSTMIKKIESQIPTHMQIYSDIYKEYLHMWDDLFGTCYIAEKQFTDKLNLDPNITKAFTDFWNMVTQSYVSQIDMSTEFLKTYSQVRISTIKTFDQYMHNMIDAYAKVLSQYNSMLGK